MKSKIKFKLSTISAAALALAVSACGDGPPVDQVEGAAVKGPLANCNVSVFDQSGALVASGATDNTGGYDVQILGGVSYPLRVSIAGGDNCVDLTTGQTPTLALQTVAIDSTVTTANANTLSTIITEAASARAGGFASISSDDIDAVSSAVLTEFGFGLDAVTSGYNPITTTMGTGGTTSLSGVVYSFEAASEVINRLGSNAADRQAALAALAADLADGDLNGVAVGNVSLPPSYASLGELVLATAVAHVTVSTEMLTNTLQLTANDGTKLNFRDQVDEIGLTTDIIGAAPLSVSFLLQVESNIQLLQSSGLDLGLNAVDSALATIVSNLPVDGSGTLNDVSVNDATSLLSASSTLISTDVTTVADSSTIVVPSSNIELDISEITISDTTSSGAVTLTPDVVSLSNSELIVSLISSKLNAANLQNVIDGVGTAPAWNVVLSHVPVGSGTMSVTATLTDAAGSATSRSLSATYTLNWLADGSEVSITAPAGNASVSYSTAFSDTVATATITNAQANVLTVGSTGTVGEQSIGIKIADLFNRDASLSAALDGVNVAGNYSYTITISGFPLTDDAGNAISVIKGGFGVQ